MKEGIQKKSRSGFTMVELMAVLIILGLLATVVVSNFVGATDRARVETTKMTLKTLHNAINNYKMDTGSFPSDDEGLEALITEPPSGVTGWQQDGYLDSTTLPLDGWGNEFIYRRYGENNRPVIISYGADGKEGGEGYDQDLESTNLRGE
jgi:general secretion pathway protein G